jgi:hypothetical protein
MNFVSKQFQPKTQLGSSLGSNNLPKIQTPEEKALTVAKTRKLNAEAARNEAITVSVYRSALSTPRKS